jgi:DNA polymerase-1
MNKLYDHNCTRCPLHKGAKHVCAEGDGPEDAEVIVIGEAPGREEDRTGKPFMGPSGQLLRHELSKAGFKSLFITNLVKCRPPDNRDPTPAEIKACRPFLDAELHAIKAKYLLTVGRFSSKAVLKRARITQQHGEIVTLNSQEGMPIFHTAYCLRDPSKLPALQQDLRRFRNHIDGISSHILPIWETVESPEALHQFIEKFEEAEEFSYDLETTGLFPYDRRGSIRCMSIGLVESAYVIPLEMPGSMFLGNHEAQVEFLQLLIQIARDTDKLAIAQNGKFDQHWMRLVLGDCFELHFDTMLASHVLDENEDHDLKYLARRYLDAPDYDISKKEKQGCYLHIPAERQKYLRYAAFDAAYTFALFWVFRERLMEGPEIRRLFYKIIMPASRALEKIERRGLTLDLDRYAQVEKGILKEKQEALGKLNSIAGRINWNSPKQIRELLYENLKLRTTVKTKKGLQSTGEDAIVELRAQHPVGEALMRYRELEKFYGTYIEGWKETIHQGKLYLGYKIHGTVTGRYSSRIHQVPRDGTIRSLITAPRGWLFAHADLSQAELRIAAELSRDLELVTCFRPGGQDVHWRTLLYMVGSGRSKEYTAPAIKTAKEISGYGKLSLTDSIEILSQKGHNTAIAVWKGWKEARKKAKAINFGFVFGMYENKFIQQAKTKYDWNCTFEEAQDFRSAYFELYRGIPPWHDRQKALVRTDGYVRNLFGRIRRLPGIYSTDKELRMECERQAINSPVQGTIGDWKTAALIEIEETIPTDELRIVGEHHDALLLIFRDEFRDSVLPRVRAIMRRPKLLETFKVKTAVPMESEIEIGPWGAGKAYRDPPCQ